MQLNYLMNTSILTYYILSFILFFFCGKASYKLNLVDLPNKRKIHSKPTAYTGGIAISIILLSSLQLFDFSDKNLNLIFSIGFLISIVGLIDDKYNLNIGGKLSLLIIPIFYLIVFENLLLKDLGNYDYFALGLGTFSIPFSLLCVLFLTNAFNYFDGIDGSLGFTTLTVLIILYFLIPDDTIRLFLLSIFIPISLFLFFNFALFNLPKLFLGDSGSLLLGFIISFILIFIAKMNLVHPILLAWSVSIFVYEFIAVNIIRIKNKKDPFRPGLDHLHHLFFDKTKSIFLSNIIISFINIFFFYIGYISFKVLNSVISLILFIAFFVFFFILRNIFLKKK